MFTASELCWLGRQIPASPGVRLWQRPASPLALCSSTPLPSRAGAFGVRGTDPSPPALRDGERSASQICSPPLGQSLLLSVAK